jgi:hypothetical protein
MAATVLNRHLLGGCRGGKKEVQEKISIGILSRLFKNVQM